MRIKPENKLRIFCNPSPAHYDVDHREGMIREGPFYTISKGERFMTKTISFATRKPDKNPETDKKIEKISFPIVPSFI